MHIYIYICIYRYRSNLPLTLSLYIIALRGMLILPRCSGWQMPRTVCLMPRG